MHNYLKRSFCILFNLLGFFLSAQVPDQRRDREYHDMPVEMAPDAIESKQAGYYVENGKYGFTYPKNTRQEAKYDKISYASAGFIVKLGKQYGLADKLGVMLTKIEYDSIAGFYQGYLVKKNGKYGTLSEKGVKILPIQYDKVLGMNRLISFAQTKTGDLQLIFNETGKTLPHKIDYAELYDNLVLLKVNGKFGVVTNEIVLPFQYDSISHTLMYPVKPSSKQAIRAFQALNYQNYHRHIQDLMVLNQGKIGLINQQGEWIYPAECDEITRRDMFGFYLAKKDKLYSIYFTGPKIRTEFEFEKVYADGAGYAMAVKNNKSGVFNLSGELIVPFEYDNDFIAQYSGIGLRVSKDKKKGIVDPKGKVLLPPIYDNIHTFYENGFRQFISVESNKKFGVVNLNNDTIIPFEFEWIGEENGFFKVATPGPNRKFGLYDTHGNIILPTQYQWITNSDTREGKLLILINNDSSYNFLNRKNQIVLSENIAEYGYVINEENLLNTYSSPNHYLLYVKSRDGKYGMINEKTGQLDIPMQYDQIIQRFESWRHMYYSVQKGRKYGLINEKNEVMIPLEYDAIDVDLVSNTDEADIPNDVNYHVVVAKNGKYGLVNLKNEVKIPFQYAELKRVSTTGLYKAKTGRQFQIIDSNGKAISKNSFDEVANFEFIESHDYNQPPQYQALTFNNGKMRVINQLGVFLTTETPMIPHQGYKSFDELKFALIRALDSDEDALLKEFAHKIAPSPHILYYLKQNIFDESSTLDYIDIAQIKDKYYEDLLEYKSTYWHDRSGIYHPRSSLAEVTDFTYYGENYVTNHRMQDHAYGDTHYMEKFLRNAIKVNGYWISSYFMHRRF